MAAERATNPEVAELLGLRRIEISRRWAASLLPAGDDEAAERLSASLLDAVEAVAWLLAGGSPAEIDRFLAGLAALRLARNLDAGDAVEAVLRLKDAAAPEIEARYPRGSADYLSAINSLDSTLRLAAGAVARWLAETMRQETESIQRVSTALLEMHDLGKVLDIVCAEARRLTGAEGSAVFLLEMDEMRGEEWLRVAHRASRDWPSYEGLPVERSFTGIAVRTGKARLSNDPASEPERVRSSVEPRSLLVLPLHAKGVAIGALDLVDKPGGFTPDDLRMMGLFADQAAIAIEDARLRRKIEQLAVVEERQRLARELHDSVNQSLYSMGLFAEAAGGLIAAGSYDRAMDHLRQLRETAQESLREMRLLIFELRPPMLEQEGLVGSLQARLDAVEARGGLQCKLLVEGDERLPAMVEDGLYRIALEALNNAFKHSHAGKVTVKVRFSEGVTRLEVSDDGIGFDPSTARRLGGMGLIGMAERARRIGAVLTIDSSPGRGASVRIEVAIQRTTGREGGDVG